MNLLHITPFYEPLWAYGGMARGSAALCRALASRGHAVTVATALLGTDAPKEETLGGVRIRRFAGPVWLDRWLVPWARGLSEFLRQTTGSFDVVHLHGHRNGLAVAAGRVLSAARRAFVLQPSGTYPHHGQYPVVKWLFDRTIGDRLLEQAAALVAVSESEARDLGRPARLVPNGVEECGRALLPAQARERPRLLFVGTDRPQKRGHLLPDLLESLPGIELHLVGRYGRSFRERFLRFGSRVEVRGVLSGDALATAYADADVLVHPAVGEAFGLVPFEAALAGTPAVVAGGHGCGEWYGRAGGAVVPPDDPRSMAEAVRARLLNRELGVAEARSVAAFTREHLRWDLAAAAVESLYHEVIGGAP